MSNTAEPAVRETIDVALDDVWACAAIGAEGAAGCDSLVMALELESPAPAWGYDEPHACQEHDMRQAARLIVNAIMEGRRLHHEAEACLSTFLALNKEPPVVRPGVLVECLLALAAMVHSDAPKAMLEYQKNLVLKKLAEL